jgi:hypothetical protein
VPVAYSESSGAARERPWPRRAYPLEVIEASCKESSAEAVVATMRLKTQRSAPPLAGRNETFFSNQWPTALYSARSLAALRTVEDHPSTEVV